VGVGIGTRFVPAIAFEVRAIHVPSFIPDDNTVPHYLLPFEVRVDGAAIIEVTSGSNLVFGREERQVYPVDPIVCVTFV
jgi:hypothetical protein